MRPETLVQRYFLRLEAAVSAVRHGMSFRKAEKTFGLPRSTVHRMVQQQLSAASPPMLPRAPVGRPPAFSPAEEQVVVDLLYRYADRGAPLNRVHLQEAFAILIGRMDEERRLRLPFRDRRPGRKFTAAFALRHKDLLRLAKPTRQEGKRFAAANADALTTHFATIARLVEDQDLDASRIWNLDETGGTPGKDISRACASRRYLRRDGIREAKVAHFANVSRSTMMPVVSAAGEAGPALFVFKGSDLPYRNVVRGGVARAFVTSVRDLTANGRKVLLTYDAYRSHMTLAVLELFDANGIIAYALPAHTSGKTQPCDCVLFASYKQHLNKSLMLAASTDSVDVVDAYSYCAMMRRSYELSFTKDTIRASFRKTGIWPLRRCTDIDRALSLAREKAKKDSACREAKKLKAMRLELARSRRERVVQVDIDRLESARWRERARLARMSLSAFRLSVRPMAERRAIAKLRRALRSAK
eukprot:IDg2656t1